MPISEAHLSKVLDAMTSDQCLELLHHSALAHAAPKAETVARALYLGIRPTRRSGTLWLLERDHDRRRYRLTADGAQVKAALEARA